MASEPRFTRASSPPTSGPASSWVSSQVCWAGGFSRGRPMSSPTRSDAAVVRLDDVTVRYRLPTQLGLTFKEYAIQRLLGRVLTPSAGRVRVRGRVAPILDLVGGFHPELTGRENIYLNGTLLGLS